MLPRGPHHPPQPCASPLRQPTAAEGRDEGQARYVLLQEWHLPVTAEVSTQPRRIAWKERKQEGKWNGTGIY